MPLQGAELEEFLAKERAAKEKEAAKKAAEDRRQRILEADAEDTDDEDDTDDDSDDEDEDENEVERELGGDEEMDTAEDGKPTKSGKRRSGKRRDMDDPGWSAAVDDDGLSKQMLSYDIYLKGNVSKATSFFKNADGQTQRFRMFPYVEKRRRIDDYGELIDVEVWMRKGKALEEHAQDEDMKELKRLKEEEEEKVCLVLSPRILTHLYSEITEGTTVKIHLHGGRSSIGLQAVVRRFGRSE